MKYFTLTKKHSQLIDVSTPHVAVDLTQVLELVTEETLTADATSIDITGLDLAASKMFIIQTTLKNVYAGNINVYLYANNDTNDLNYYHQYLNANNTTVVAARVNGPAIVGIANQNESATLTMFMQRDSGGTAWANIIGVADVASALKLKNRVWVHNDTTNVTQLTFTASQANGLGSGSTVLIFKLG